MSINDPPKSVNMNCIGLFGAFGSGGHQELEPVRLAGLGFRS